MSTGNPSFNPTPAKSLESLKETFKKRLNAILYKQLTVENIETFADEALSGTVKLTDDILAEYKTNPNLHLNQIPLDKREQENEAYAILGLPNISEILQSIINVKEKIDAIGKYINRNNEVTDEVMIPAQADSLLEIKSGSGKGIENKKFIPRLLILLYILEIDFEIPKEEIKIAEGTIAPGMVRQTPYVRVEVSDIERVIYICDEEGNASFVFDTDKLEKAGIKIENLDISDKGAIKKLLAEQPGIGARIIQTKYWRTNMVELLGNPIPEKIQEEKEDTTEEPSQLVSEFRKREKKEFLPFDKFQAEIRNLYSKEKEDNVKKWYEKEKLKLEHKNWPSAPDQKYKDNGWQGWPELVGKENPLKKEHPTFNVFQVEVMKWYRGENDIQEWYGKERLNHPDWSSIPDIIYKDTGWKGWPELVGKENRFKKEYLPFDKFQAEVVALYPGGDIQGWYYKIKQDHPNWPSNPQKIYKDKGWVDWRVLVGKESLPKREFPPFNIFQTEVRERYRGQSGVERWYDQEKKDHPNWPINARSFYKNKGWTSWPELVGKK